MPTPIALKAGASIGAYKINKVLATTQFGVLYRAVSAEPERVVGIQEFLPRELATRTRSTAKVRGRKGKEHLFEEALTLFLQEARILAQIHDPYVARVHEYTEANGTAYLVLEHDLGRSLEAQLAKHPETMGETELRNILIPVLKGLRAVHNANLLHRDITPTAIYLRREGPPLLTWFGACHRAPKIDSSLGHRISPGYSPIEFYHENTRQEPASDLYSLGAVMYRCISGSAPVDPTQRLAALAQNEEDPLVPAMEIGRGSFSSTLLGTIDWMLQPMLQDRPDSAGAVLGPLSKTVSPTQSATQSVPAPRPTRLDVPVPQRSAPPPVHSSRRGWLWTFAVIVPALTLWLAWPFVKPLIDSSSINETPVQNDPDPGPARVSDPKPVVAVDKPVPADPNDGALEQTANTNEGEVPQTVTPALGDPELEDPPPEVPETVKFTRSGDDQRAQLYRQIQRNQLETEQLLLAARAHLADGKQLVALQALRRVLSIDPGNADAKESIAQISDQLIAHAKQAMEVRNIPQVETLITQIEAITPDHFALDPLKQKLADYQSEQQRIEEQNKLAELEKQKEIDTLLNKATAAAARGQFMEPPADNALEFYRAVLALDPQHAAAKKGISQVALAYLDRANRALALDDFSRAETHLVTATAIQPDNPAIGLLRQQLNARRAAARSKPALAPAVVAKPPPISAPPAKQVTNQEQKTKEEELDLRRGIESYYAGSYDKARRLLLALAKKEYPRAQFRLGMMYYLGRGVVKNRLVAEEWIRKSLPEIRRLAQQGIAWAQADLGSLYEDGLVLDQDTSRAVRWYTRAAEQGYAGAQTNLGVMYAKGIGVEINIFTAIRWLERAAAQGDRVARENLLTLRNEE